MDAFNRALDNIRRLWGQLGAAQKIVLAASAVLLAALLTWGSAGGTGDSMVRVVGREVDEATRSKVLQRLAQGQKHELRDREIYVPRADADRIMLELAGEGVIGDDAVWKFLEQDNIFSSKWTLEKRYQVALQRRLEGMVRKIDGVRNASVLVNPGSTASSLGFAGAKASASVQVDLREDAGLKSANVQAIAGLIARAAPGIEVDQVHIMDTRGRPYRALKPDSSVFQAQNHREYEQQIEQQIQNDIKASLPSAMVVVRVQARNSDVVTEEVRHTNPKVAEIEERKEVRKGGGAQAPVGLKGEGSFPAPVDSSSGESSTSSETREKNAFDVSKTQVRDPAGAIKKITVGVLIPVEVGADGKALEEAEKLLPTYKEWVQKAAGPEADQNSVSVQLIPSRRPEAVAAAAIPEGLLEWSGRHAGSIAIFALGLAGLVLLLRGVGRAISKEPVDELSELTAALSRTAEGGGEGDAGIGDPLDSEVQRLKAGLREMVNKNPQHVASSLKAFLGGQGK
jgi:flagellar biosynthesis/type III secretory pathway M-ring protein FliF/YscJ